MSVIDWDIPEILSRNPIQYRCSAKDLEEMWDLRLILMLAFVGICYTDLIPNLLYNVGTVLWVFRIKSNAIGKESRGAGATRHTLDTNAVNGKLQQSMLHNVKDSHYAKTPLNSDCLFRTLHGFAYLLWIPLPFARRQMFAAPIVFHLVFAFCFPTSFCSRQSPSRTLIPGFPTNVCNCALWLRLV